MPRRPRIDYDGAIQHVAVNGNNRQSIFLDTADRFALLRLLEGTVERYGWEVLSYCLMDTHWHLLVRTPKTLSVGLQRLNSQFSRGFNKRHGRSGHSIRHRFMSVAVETDAHMVALSRYIPLNPVHAGLIGHPADWAWSSYREQIGLDPPTPWLAVGWPEELHGSVAAYRNFVENPPAELALTA
jgi:REP element-mobilizing transposase RayT